MFALPVATPVVPVKATPTPLVRTQLGPFKAGLAWMRWDQVTTRELRNSVHTAASGTGPVLGSDAREPKGRG